MLPKPLPKRNRGKQPNDDKLFAAHWHPTLAEAVDDLCFLMSRGYAHKSALQVVGNRYKLNKRQRLALFRISSSKQEVALRKSHRQEKEALKGASIDIDGFNLLILLESAMSGAYIFKGRDGTYRDISSVHGSYKRVRQTEEAILMTGKVLQELGVYSANWFLDKPISNSGRLKTRLREMAEKHGFNWRIELVNNPDKVLSQSNRIVVSSDGWILDHSEKWFNLGGHIIENHIQEATVVTV